MGIDWNSPELARGLECYRGGTFFEAHEHWECVWLTLDEPEKSFLQAIIQITAAMHHLRRGNRIGAASLLRRSLKRLSKCPSIFGGIDVEQLRQELSASLEAIGSASLDVRTIHPDIQLVNARPK